MPGEPDPLYVKARKVLLDALAVLEPHLDALVLVGAQAVYLHTGDADLAVAEYTIDADRKPRMIGALDAGDPRHVEISVAGPGALFIAKLHKIAERVDNHDRSRDKDALDVLRLLRAVPTRDLTDRLTVLLASDLAGPVTAEALDAARELFSREDAVAARMAARAADGLEDAAVIAASAAALTTDLLAALERHSGQPAGR